MASLALMVSLIFLSVLLLGPLSMLLHRIGLRTCAAVVAVMAVLIGGYWTIMAPFPVSIIGGISALMGLMTIRKY